MRISLQLWDKGLVRERKSTGGIYPGSLTLCKCESWFNSICEPVSLNMRLGVSRWPPQKKDG